MKQIVRVEVEVDVDAYRREYGEPEATVAEARDYVEQLVLMGATQVLRSFDYATVKEPNQVTEEPVSYAPRSWAPEVFVDGGWAGNGLRFRTEDEAIRSGRELLSRWFVPTDSRAVPSTDRPNYRLTDEDRNVGLCSECELDATPGTGLCAGHNRLESYDATAEFAANN